MAKKIVRKVFVNKRTKQFTVSLPKKELKINNPSLKFGEDLFVNVYAFNKSRKKK